MSKLKIDYKNDVFSGNRKYNLINNTDSTISLEDVTSYDTEGDMFGADDINKTNSAINNLSDYVTAISPKVTIKAKEGSEVTAKNGDIILIETAGEDNQVIFYLTNKGTWTFSDGNRTSEQDITDCGSYDINFMTTIYGIKREVASLSTKWTRTDDAVGLTATASVGNTAGHSDFDAMPIYENWVARKQFTNGNMMTGIPKFYFKRWIEDGWEYIQIADMETDGFSLFPAFDRPDGVHDLVWLGSYKTSSNNKSVRGASPQVSQTLATMRSNAKALGSGWGLYDFATNMAVKFLYLIEFADYDTQTIIGEGYTASGHSGAISTGTCDAVPNYTGRPSGTSNNVDVVYRGLEGLWGNVYEFLDGINFYNGIPYVCLDPSKYACDTTNNYTALSLTIPISTSWVYQSQMGCDPNNPAWLVPVVAGGTSSTYMCDGLISNTGYRIALVSCFWADSTLAGLFVLHAYDGSSHYGSDTGSRLQYLEPLA